MRERGKESDRESEATGEKVMERTIKREAGLQERERE